MLLVYTHKVTPRLTYTFKHFFTRILQVQVEFTSKVEKFIAHNGLKLTYGKQPLGNEIFVKSTDLLFEQGINDTEINMGKWDGVECFFQVRQEAHVPFDIFDAVQSVEPGRPVDFAARLDALKGFVQRPEAASLAAGHKRVNNMLKKAKLTGDTAVNESLFSEKAESALYEALAATREPVAIAVKNADYEDALDLLSGLRESVDAFFDDVMVMADDEAVKTNRLALLQQLRDQFSSIADVGLLKIDS